MIAFAALAAACEAAGLLPSQLLYLVVPMIPKSNGGLRCLGMFSAFYRLLTRCRRVFADQWALTNDHVFFASGKGRGPTDVIWKAVVLDEAALAGNSGKKGRGRDDRKVESASVLWDAVHFYDRFSLEKLVYRAIAFKANLRLIRLCLAAYRLPRFLSCRGRALGAIDPAHSIVAGCCFADMWVKVYTLPWFLRLQRCHPAVSFHITSTTCK